MDESVHFLWLSCDAIHLRRRLSQESRERISAFPISERVRVLSVPQRKFLDGTFRSQQGNTPVTRLCLIKLFHTRDIVLVSFRFGVVSAASISVTLHPAVSARDLRDAMDVMNDAQWSVRPHRLFSLYNAACLLRMTQRYSNTISKMQWVIRATT